LGRKAREEDLGSLASLAALFCGSLVFITGHAGIGHCREMRFPILLFVPPALALAASACATKLCTLVGCDNSLSVTYAAPIDGAYSLAVSVGGVDVTVSCPNDPPVGTVVTDAGVGGPIEVQCSRDGFVLRWTAEKALGTIAADAPSMDVAATMTPSGKAAMHGTATATSPTADQPNGPACGPTCYVRKASMTLAP